MVFGSQTAAKEVTSQNSELKMNQISHVCFLMNIVNIKAWISERRTLFACEGSSMSFTCEEGTSINIIRANFGRFSNSVCPSDSKDISWSNRCLHPISLRVVNSVCGGKRICSVPASSIWNLSIGVNQNQRLQEEHHLFHHGSWP